MRGFPRSDRRMPERFQVSRRLRLVGAALTTLLVMVAFMSLGPAGHTSAQATVKQAYLWANEPSTDAYTPDERYQYNTTGELNTVTRTGVGVYVVNLPGMVKEGNSQVTATSSSDAGVALGSVCAIVTNPTAENGALQQTVNCYDTDGAPADSGFLLLSTQGDVFLGSYSAYLYANDRSAEAYTPDEHYQFNSTGAANTITRTAVGSYTVTLPGLGVERGNIQVTSANDTPGISCLVANWGIAEDQAKTVNVSCFDANAQPFDAPFTLLHVVGSTSSDEAMVWPRGAYVFMGHGEQADRHVPNQAYQFNSTGAANEAEWLDTGHYYVHLPGLGVEGGTFLVTAVVGQYGLETTANACSMPRWLLDEENMVIEVSCFGPDGTPQNSAFNVMYVIPEP